MKTEKTLFERINKIHKDCFQLCKLALSKYLPVSGNVGVFCQSGDEYKRFIAVRKKITENSNNPNQKYFLLKEPFTIPDQDKVPQTTYTHLYIRKPDTSPYGNYRGDVDFVVKIKEYEDLRNKVKQGCVKGAEMYDRSGWETFHITDPSVNSIAYVSTKEFAIKVRFRFD